MTRSSPARKPPADPRFDQEEKDHRRFVANKCTTKLPLAASPPEAKGPPANLTFAALPYAQTRFALPGKANPASTELHRCTSAGFSTYSAKKMTRAISQTSKAMFAAPNNPKPRDCVGRAATDIDSPSEVPTPIVPNLHISTPIDDEPKKQ